MFAIFLCVWKIWHSSWKIKFFLSVHFIVFIIVVYGTIVTMPTYLIYDNHHTQKVNQTRSLHLLVGSKCFLLYKTEKGELGLWVVPFLVVCHGITSKSCSISCCLLNFYKHPVVHMQWSSWLITFHTHTSLNTRKLSAKDESEHLCKKENENREGRVKVISVTQKNTTRELQFLLIPLFL